MKRFTPQNVLKNNWEQEANFEISKKEWYSYCDFQQKCTSSHTCWEFEWKCLIRFFITPKQKAHFLGEDPKCWRLCGSQNNKPLACVLGMPSYKKFLDRYRKHSKKHSTLKYRFNLKLSFLEMLIFNQDTPINVFLGFRHLLVKSV